MENKPLVVDIENINEKEIFDALAWGSYWSNRDGGVSHESLAKWGIAKPGFKEKYDSLKTKNS